MGISDIVRPTARLWKVLGTLSVCQLRCSATDWVIRAAESLLTAVGHCSQLGDGPMDT